MRVLGEIAKSDYITCAARSYRMLEQDDIPADHPVSTFHRIYTEIAGTDGVIDRAAFDPARYPSILQWVQLFERSADRRFKVRLMGTGIARLLKGDFTGWFLDEYIGGIMLEHRHAEFNDAIDLRTPQMSMSVIHPENGAEWDVYRGAFPARKGSRDLIFVVLAPDGERLAKP